MHNYGRGKPSMTPKKVGFICKWGVEWQAVG